MPFCEQCGVEIGEDTRFCTTCGSRRIMEEGAGAERTGTGRAEELVWSAKMPIATSTIVMKQLVLVFLAGFGIVALLILVIDPGAFLAILPPLGGILLFFIALAVLISVMLQVWTRGGLDADFAITRKGIGYRAGKTSRDVNTATLAGSVLGGSLSGTGGSLINISREMDFMEWKEMRSVTIHERERGLVFTRKAFIFPLALWCTRENFGTAQELVRRFAPHLKVKRKRW
jgi:hypothetical protein